MIPRLAPLCLLAALGACTATTQAVHPAAHASLAVAHDALAQGSPETAIEIAHGVLTAAPHDAGALTLAADAEAALGQNDAARRDYAAALAALPDSAAARRGLAKLRLRTDPAGAEAALRALLARAPDDAATLTDCGVALDLQGRHAEAQDLYRRALRASPGLASALVDLGLSQALSGHAAEAEAGLRGIAATPRARANLAVAQAMAGDEAEAGRTLRADLSPEEAETTLAALRTLREQTLR